MKDTTIDDLFLGLVEDHRRVIYKVCACYASAEFPVVDLFQDVLCNLWRAYPGFRGEASPLTWIYRIALNTCISAVRRQGRRPKYERLPEWTDYFTEPDSWDDEIRWMYALIQRLGTLERALVLLYLEERSYQEMAEITGLTLTNVGTVLCRAKNKLKNMSND